MGGARALTSHWTPAKPCEVGAVSAWCERGVRGTARPAACARPHCSGVLVPASVPLAAACAGPAEGIEALSLADAPSRSLPGWRAGCPSWAVETGSSFTAADVR